MNRLSSRSPRNSEVNRTVQHVDLSWNPTPWSGLVPFGIADGRASGLLFERHESFGIHDDGRFPRAVGKVTAPGVFDAVANFDTNIALLILELRGERERLGALLALELDRVSFG
jgi:hypothetical protein